MVAISVLLHPVQPGRVARPRRGLSLISAALLYRYRHGDGTCAWHGRAVSYEGGHGRRVPARRWLRGRRMVTPLTSVARTPGRVQYLLYPGPYSLAPRGRPASAAARAAGLATCSPPPARPPGDCRSGHSELPPPVRANMQSTRKQRVLKVGTRGQPLESWNGGCVGAGLSHANPGGARPKPRTARLSTAEGVAWVKSLSLLRSNACCVRVVGISRVDPIHEIILVYMYSYIIAGCRRKKQPHPINGLGGSGMSRQLHAHISAHSGATN